MYSLEYLPIARRDLVEAVSYISHDLGSPEAALRLAEEVERAGERRFLLPEAERMIRRQFGDEAWSGNTGSCWWRIFSCSIG